MTSDAALEARERLVKGYAAGYEWVNGAEPSDVDAFESAVRTEAQRDLAARVLPVLREVEWSCPDGLMRSTCPICTAARGDEFLGKPLRHNDRCTLAELIESLRALVGEEGQDG